MSLSNQQKLHYIITKAIEGGWEYLDGYSTVEHFVDSILSGHADLNGHPENGENLWEILYTPPHNFAKSLWGEEWPRIDLTSGKNVPDEDTYKLGALEPYWQSQLKQAVISEDPINYIYESIKD
jgi:hypothetical protein